jgi:glycine/D-amino acid oxidase-like deaminating enzyme
MRTAPVNYDNGDVSYWMASTDSRRAHRAPLDSPGQVDVVIVGAGFTGLWAAYYLTETAPHLTVGILEAEHVGYGASGRNGGWLSHLVPGNRARYGREPAGHAGAVALQRAMVHGVDEVLRVADTEKIDADQRRGGNLVLASTPAGLDRLSGRHEADLRYGLADDESCLLTAEETRARVNAHGVLGGLYYPCVARIHPARMVTGLARVVEARGVKIYENSPVTRVESGRVSTDRASLTAPHVLVCTEGYGGPILGSRRITPINSSMIVTDPLPAADWQRIGWKSFECLSDAAHTFIYAQRTADDRIAVGGRGAPYRFASGTAGDGVTPERTVQELLERLNRYFPSADLRVAHAWSGVLGVTRDWCASVRYEARTGIGSASGYAGHGVTATNVAARTLVDLVLGRATALTRLPWVDYRSPRWEPEPLRWLGIHGMYRLFRAADRWEEARGSARTSLLARLGGRLAGLSE